MGGRWTEEKRLWITPDKVRIQKVEQVEECHSDQGLSDGEVSDSSGLEPEKKNRDTGEIFGGSQSHVEKSPEVWD